MFYLTYILAELRRRSGRTILTALGLAIGVGLVVTVNALSHGLNDAQAKVLEPLTGVGTDMSVTRPIRFFTGTGPWATESRLSTLMMRLSPSTKTCPAGTRTSGMSVPVGPRVSLVSASIGRGGVAST